MAEQFYMIAGLSTFSIVALYGFGQVFRRVIGSVYLSPDEKLVRISHLSFFGNRKEKICSLGSVHNLTDTNPDLEQIFLQVELQDPRTIYYFTLKYGGIMDYEKFEKIFGYL